MIVPQRIKIKYATVLSRKVASGRMALCTDFHGFTLVELITVMGVLAALVVMALPTYNGYLISVRNGRCVADLRTIDKAVTAYTLEKNSPPANLSDIGVAANQLDPWKRNYVYQNLTVGGATPLEDEFGVALNTDYDLYSMGVDGASNTSYANPTSADDIARHNNGSFVGLRSQ